MTTSRKKKEPRTTAFTARELIVELSKCDPMSRVYFGPIAVTSDSVYGAPVVAVVKREKCDAGEVTMLKAVDAGGGS